MRAEKISNQFLRAAEAPAPQRRQTGTRAARKNWYEPTQKLLRTTGTRSSEASIFAEVTIGSDGYDVKIFDVEICHKLLIIRI